MNKTLKTGATLTVAAAFAAAALGFFAGKLGVNPLLTKEDSGAEALRRLGYEDIKATGYGWFDCGIGEDSDLWRTRFSAKNPKGDIVPVTICEGIFKGATPRF